MADNGKKKTSHVGFFVALLVVVAVGGGAYLYLDKTLFTPVEAQQDTLAANPGTPHPPKKKTEAAAGGKADAKPTETVTTDAH